MERCVLIYFCDEFLDVLWEVLGDGVALLDVGDDVVDLFLWVSLLCEDVLYV